jgi:hypothetical protein
MGNDYIALKNNNVRDLSAKSQVSNFCGAKLVPNNKNLDARTSQQSALKATAYVVDDFAKKSVDLNFDGKADITHGDLVSAYLRSKGIEPINIERNQVRGNRESGFLKLIELAEKIESGKLPVGAVNLSWGININIETFGRKLALPLNADNLQQYRDRIIERLQTLKTEGDLPLYSYKKRGLFRDNIIEDRPSTFLYRIEVCERLVRLGCPIYRAAGNNGHIYFDPVSLAKGVITVGALNGNGKIAEYSGHNSLVKKWATGDYSPSLVKGGIDLTNDGLADIAGITQSSPRTTPHKVESPLRSLKESANFNEICNAIFVAALKRGFKDGQYSAQELLKNFGATSSLQNKYKNMNFEILGLTTRKEKTIVATKREIAGTSFATPVALATDLVKARK